MKTRSKLLLVTSMLAALIITGLYASSRDRTPKLNLDPTLRQTYRSPVLFELLGYIREYNGRYILVTPDDRIDHFFISEKQAANNFQALLKQLKEQYNLDTEIERIEDEHFIDFYSRELTDIINSCFIPSDYMGRQIDPESGTETGCYACILDPDFLDSASQEEMLSYLKGAHNRYGDNNRFSFANSGQKVNLIASYLNRLNCTQVTVMNTFAIPCSNSIVFKPSRKVQEVLNIKSLFDIVLQETNPDTDI